MRKGSPHGPAVVFDFGGVLLHWDPAPLFGRLLGRSAPEVAAFLEEIGFYAWNLELDRGRPLEEALRDLATRYPRYAHVIYGYDDRWVETVLGPVPGSVEVLRALKDAGRPLYGLSNWSAATFPRVRPRYPFFGWFRDILLSGDVGLVKPDPGIFRLLLDRIDRPAQECLLIDDNARNTEAAAGLGFQTIHFTTGPALREELGRRGLIPT